MLLLNILILWMIFYQPNIEDYNKKRKRKVLIIFDDMISHATSDKKAQQILKDLFIRCRKLNISICFLTQSYFSVLKDVRLNCTQYILFKLNNKRELQNIAINHSPDIDYEDFVKIYRICTRKPFNFLTMILKPINLLKSLMRLYKIWLLKIN